MPLTTSLLRTLRASRPAPAVTVAVAAALIALTAGCATASSTGSGATVGAATPASPTSPTATSATATPAPVVSTAMTEIVLTPSPTSVAVTATATVTVTGGPPQVYWPEGGSVTGTTIMPGCAAGCPLSGDATTSLWNMTWTTWDNVQAVGNGTEKIDDCGSDCATGKDYAVKVSVVFSKPVQVCVPGGGKFFWTQVNFTWPDGLPSVFAGDNAPVNPFTYSGIASEGAPSCP